MPENEEETSDRDPGKQLNETGKPGSEKEGDLTNEPGKPSDSEETNPEKGEGKRPVKDKEEQPARNA